MSIPASYSDRPLWIILTVDAALTPVGAFVAAKLLHLNSPLEAMWNGALGTGIVVGSGVVLVGIASLIRDLVALANNPRITEEITTSTPTPYIPARPTQSARGTAKEWQHPTPIPLPSIPDQYISPTHTAEADEESLEAVTMGGSNDSLSGAPEEEAFAAENN